MRRQFLVTTLIILGLNLLGYFFFPPILWSLLLFGPLFLFGIRDYFNTTHTIRRNFPIIGRFRYWFEAIRPEISQYFVESNTDGVPFNREQRSIVYQRAKGELDTLPFGTKRDLYEVGYEWVHHSLSPQKVDPKILRVVIGTEQCKHPYNASLLNISAMSFGSISKNAVMALNGGAKDGGFAHNTGEGGVSRYHLEAGGDLIWQIGTAYFGCREKDGSFSEEGFAKTATLPSIKMIELKLSQGAKPGHGGILPGRKVNREIATIRHVPEGIDCVSPAAHSAFSTPVEMMLFIQRLRELSGGKPVGFKLCLGAPREFLGICKAIEKTGILPDFIAVDGGEGGTGAAPLEFSNHIGSPGIESLIFVQNALTGFSLRQQIKIIGSGKMTSGFGMVKRLALGADVISSARAMMFALGCIQALRCNTNRCPTGVTTQDPNLVAGLHVPDKRKRVAMFHQETIQSVADILSAMGLKNATGLRPWHIIRRVSRARSKSYAQIFEFLSDGDLLKPDPPSLFALPLRRSSADSFVGNPYEG